MEGGGNQALGGTLGASASFQAKVAAGSKWEAGSAPTSGSSTSQKGRRYRIGHRQDFGRASKGASAKTPAPAGLAHSLTARQAPQQPEKLLDRRRRRPHARRRIIRPRRWHGRWSHVGQLIRQAKARWWGAGMSDSDASNTSARSDRSAPAIRNAQLVRDHSRLGRTGGAACDLAHLQWIAEAQAHSPQGPRKAQRLAVIKIQPSSESATCGGGQRT